MGNFLDNFGKFASGASGIAGAISSIGGLISSIGAGKRDLNRRKELAAYENELAMQMYSRQYDDQLAMYKMQLADQRALRDEDREYNDYSSVADRARKAGINPLAVIGQSSGAGLSSLASTPSASVPSAGAGSIPSSGLDGSSLALTAGSTLAAQTRQFALLDTELREAKANAKVAENEAMWSERNLAQNYEKNEAYIENLNAGTLNKKLSARLATVRIEGEQIKNDILAVDRTVAQATISDKISLYNTQAKQAIEILKQSEVDTEFKRETVIAQLERYNTETDAIGERLKIDWANVNISQQNADTALKQYGLNREEVAYVDSYRTKMLELEEQDQKLREKIARADRTQRYIEMVGDWIIERNRINDQREAETNKFKSQMTSTAASAFVGMLRFVAK